MSDAPTPSTPAPAKRENILLNLACNIAVPSFVLSMLSEPKWLGPVWGLLVALVFPVGYGIFDFVQRKKANFISIIGFASVLLTGGFGLMKVGGLWFAVKDASIPALIGIMVLWSQRSSRPMVRELLFNEQVIDIAKVDAALDAHSSRPAFDSLLAQSSYLLALGFLLSAILNFILATVILKSPPGTPAFNAELGRMHLLSWPVIVLPCLVITMVALYRLLKGIEQLTGLSFDDMFHQPEKKREAS
ncbi:MAG: VC0807 family protein [Opitutaceae bacterium]|jgi:hypothetical protein